MIGGTHGKPAALWRKLHEAAAAVRAALERDVSAALELLYSAVGGLFRLRQGASSSFCWHVPLFSLRKYSIHIALSDSPKLLAAAEYISFCSFHRLLYAAIAHSVLLCGWFSTFSLFFNSSLLLVSPNPDVSQINFIIIIRIRTFVKRKNILSG